MQQQTKIEESHTERTNGMSRALYIFFFAEFLTGGINTIEHDRIKINKL